jgi:hypothetical protein
MQIAQTILQLVGNVDGFGKLVLDLVFQMQPFSWLWITIFFMQEFEKRFVVFMEKNWWGYDDWVYGFPDNVIW